MLIYAYTYTSHVFFFCYVCNYVWLCGPYDTSMVDIFHLEHMQHNLVASVSSSFSLLKLSTPKALSKVELPDAKFFTWSHGPMESPESMRRHLFLVRNLSGLITWKKPRKSAGAMVQPGYT